MNFKKLSPLALIALLFSFNECVGLETITEKDLKIEQEIIDSIYQKALAVTGMPSNTPMPEIIYKLRKEGKQEPEDCSKYKKKEEIKRCKRDNKSFDRIQNNIASEALPDKITLYTQKTADILYARNLWPKDKRYRVFICAIFAHEIGHTIYWKKGVDGNDHHKLMKESKYLEAMIDFLGEKFGVDIKNISKEFAVSLDLGIQRDKIIKRREDRQKNTLQEENKNKMQEKGVPH